MKCQHTETTPSDKALYEFMEIICKIGEAVDAIGEAADEHFDLTPDEIHWGHVGDAKRTLAGLDEILATIRGEILTRSREEF